MDAASTSQIAGTGAARRRFYRERRFLLIAACVAPLLVLAGLWWLVTQVWLAPGRPDAHASAAQIMQFMVHPQGLPRLRQQAAEDFLDALVRRLAADTAFRDRFLSELRSSSPDDQIAFAAHLFDAFKPRFMRDVHRFHELQPDGRRDFLDDRIVAYNRMSRCGGKNTIAADALRGFVPKQQEMLKLLMEHMTAQERQLATAYYLALQARVAEILAEPELKAQFEERIAGG